MLKIKHILPMVLLVIGAVVYSAFNQAASTGAPAASTGAPGEVTCYKSGCHSDVGLNTGPGITSIVMGDNETEYTPGVTYPVTVSLSQANIYRFGFEFVALRDNDDTNIGSLAMTEPGRTQVLPGSNDFPNRRYVTYKFDGTNPKSAGLGEWTFNWTAPATDEGDITFYVATVAANNDATDNGDLVYTETLTISSKTVSGIHENEWNNEESDFLVYQVNNQIHFILPNGVKNAIILVYNLNGQFVQELIVEAGNSHTAVTPEKTMQSGIYLVQCISGSTSSTKKLFIQ
ncbi:MAG: T9SS type A sorting domain-containing protein [Bacteroidetes bacterium]|nr:T9SS type A sorting domain-containing protein [Bacteroidota bacterium]